MVTSKIGVIGAGAFTEMCLEAYQQFLPEIVIESITDLKISQAKKVAKKFGIKDVAKNPAELLKIDSITTVIILTPPNTHRQLAWDGLEAEKNVLVEKPIAFTESEARSLIELAEKKGRQLTANLVLRYHPFHQRLREIVQQGTLGQLREIVTKADMARYPTDHWYWNAKISGGFFLNTYCHFIDLYNYIIGDQPTRFACQQKTGYSHLIELGFPKTQVRLKTNLDVSNDQESVETTYTFDNGVVTTFGWLPTRMVTSTSTKTEELNETLPKLHPYQQLFTHLF